MVCTINTSSGPAFQWLEMPRGLGVGLSVQLPGSQLHGPLGGLFLRPLGFHFSSPFLSLFRASSAFTCLLSASKPSQLSSPQESGSGLGWVLGRTDRAAKGSPLSLGSAPPQLYSLASRVPSGVAPQNWVPASPGPRSPQLPSCSSVSPEICGLNG